MDDIKKQISEFKIVTKAIIDGVSRKSAARERLKLNMIRKACRSVMFKVDKEVLCMIVDLIIFS